MVLRKCTTFNRCSYLYGMKKNVIWFVGLTMAVCCMGLIYMQVSYIEAMVRMRKQHFDEGVKRSLYQVAYNLELDETRRYLTTDLQKDLQQNIHRSHIKDGFLTLEHSYMVSSSDGAQLLIESNTKVNTKVGTFPKTEKPGSNVKLSLIERQHLALEMLRQRYKYQRAMLDEVVYNMLYQASLKPLEQRINFRRLDQNIKSELANNGITLEYHFRVMGGDGRETYKCSDYVCSARDNTYKELIFKNDPPARMGILEVNFPADILNNYLYSSVKFMIPSILLTFVLLVTFVITLYNIVRQKKITEIKNDFINNMTHEFKTPISTISLAAQMLQDGSVAKSPEVFGRLSGVIASETKRLRFQVDKVLQMSMFEDRKTASLKMKELDAHELLAGVINTFTVKVEQSGGHIEWTPDADDPYIYVDEMHFTNVIFNLMDNALKYKKRDEPLNLDVRTWNSGNKFMISIRDNGIGIRKEDLKKIFDKFYRVHTGNLHDVKGFGLGLAYVKQIIQAQGGTIRAESEIGVGTTFVIVLPLK